MDGLDAAEESGYRDALNNEHGHAAIDSEVLFSN